MEHRHLIRYTDGTGRVRYAEDWVSKQLGGEMILVPVNEYLDDLEGEESLLDYEPGEIHYEEEEYEVEALYSWQLWLKIIGLFGAGAVLLWFLSRVPEILEEMMDWAISVRIYGGQLLMEVGKILLTMVGVAFGVWFCFSVICWWWRSGGDKPEEPPPEDPPAPEERRLRRTIIIINQNTEQ